MDTSEETECNFKWGECRTDGSEIVGKHVCKYAVINGRHSGLHACAYCGLVYLTRQPQVINLQFSDQPGAAAIQFKPVRGDEVSRWLKAWRDSISKTEPSHGVIDAMLDDYREHADTGTPLDAEIERGKM